jgi:hypothetical protein
MSWDWNSGLLLIDLLWLGFLSRTTMTFSHRGILPLTLSSSDPLEADVLYAHTSSITNTDSPPIGNSDPADDIR